MKRTVIIICVILLIACMESVVAYAGTSKDSAVQINKFDSVVYGTLENLGETDWYVFKTSSEPSYYWFYLENESVDSNYLNSYPRLQVVSSRDKEIGYCESVSKTECFNAKLDVNQKYYIKVFCPYNKGTGNYNLKVVSKGDFVGNSKESSYRININEKYDFGLEGKDDIDWFSFSVSSSGNYSFYIENINVESNYLNDYPRLKLYSERDKELGYCDAFVGKECDFSVELDKGAYYLQVFCPYNKGTGTYSIRISQCANGHTASGEWLVSKEPTCTLKGERIQRCSVCNEICKTEAIDAIGHSFNEWKIKNPATWMSLGEKESVCSVCGEVKTAKDWSKLWILPMIIISICMIVWLIKIIIQITINSINKVLLDKANVSIEKISSDLSKLEKRGASHSKMVKMVSLINDCSTDRESLNQNEFVKKQIEIDEKITQLKNQLHSRKSDMIHYKEKLKKQKQKRNNK